jgi:hypothetical protein
VPALVWAGSFFFFSFFYFTLFFSLLRNQLVFLFAGLPLIQSGPFGSGRFLLLMELKGWFACDFFFFFFFFFLFPFPYLVCSCFSIRLTRIGLRKRLFLLLWSGGEE